MGQFIPNIQILKMHILNIFLSVVYFLSSFTSCNDIVCENGFTKKKVMMHAQENYKLETVSDFTDLHCKVAYKNSVDCPLMRFSCSTFDIPCDSDEVSLVVKIGGDNRQSYCRDNPPDVITDEYLWVFLDEDMGHNNNKINCTISCATA